MKTLKLDNSGDIVLNEKKELELVTSVEEVSQRLKIKLKTHFQEWFLDANFGVDWINLLGAGNKSEIEFAIIEVLENDNAVEEIQEIDLRFEREQRIMTIDVVILLDVDEIINLEVEVG